MTNKQTNELFIYLLIYFYIREMKHVNYSVYYYI